MTVLVILFVEVALVAFANGANDNFKGVATLYGSGATTYPRALAWATVTTLLGSITAFSFAESLLIRFSGKGLVSEATAADPRYAGAVALAAGGTVLLATRFGFPISTTHALVGAMIGAAQFNAAEVTGSTLGTAFVLPLLVCPAVAACASVVAYPVLTTIRRRFDITKLSCICIGTELVPTAAAPGEAACLIATPAVTVTSGDTRTCVERYDGHVLGLKAGTLLDFLHFLTAFRIGTDKRSDTLTNNCNSTSMLP